MHLESNQATPDDRDRARAWLREHDEWIGMQRSESQGEPSADPDPENRLNLRGQIRNAELSALARKVVEELLRQAA